MKKNFLNNSGIAIDTEDKSSLAIGLGWGQNGQLNCDTDWEKRHE